MQNPTPRETKLMQIMEQFADRVKHSKDPVVSDAAHRMKCDIKRVCPPSNKNVK